LRYSPLTEAPEFVSFLKDNIGDGRVLNIGQQGTLYPEYGAMYGIKQADTQNPGLFPWYEKFFETYFGNDTFMFLALDGASNKKRKKSSRKENTLDEQALDVASIKYILVEDGAKSYLDFLHSKNYPVVYQKEGLSIFENVDYVPSVSLAPASMGEKLDATRLSGRVNTLSYRNTEVIIETETDAPVTLVLSDVWHPAWRATVDDFPVDVTRVNEAFRGISLSAGKHRVRFYYDPPALRYGIYAMMAAAFAMLLLLASYGWQRRNS
ncbi:MAG TPA: YfhO family protein, partial [Pseudomonadales bacterium]|nr:YfhO family protein [Pseudomonadales bacterium]